MKYFISRHNSNYEYVIRALPNIQASTHTHTSSKCDSHHYSHNDKGHNKQSQSNPCPCRIKKITKIAYKTRYILFTVTRLWTLEYNGQTQIKPSGKCTLKLFSMAPFSNFSLNTCSCVVLWTRRLHLQMFSKQIEKSLIGLQHKWLGRLCSVTFAEGDRTGFFVSRLLDGGVRFG